MRRLVCVLSCFGLVATSALTPAAAATPLRVISRNSSGQAANQGAELPTLSETGRFVAFSSISDNLVPRDRNGMGDIFWRDRRKGITKIVSVSSSERRSNRSSDTPSISGDGHKIVFTSEATNLVGHDDNDREDVFVRNLRTGRTRLVSRRPNGTQFNLGTLHETAISANGRYVAFIGLDRRERRDGGIYVGDLRTGRTTWIARGRGPALNADGSKIVYSAFVRMSEGGVTLGDQVVVEDVRTGRRRIASRSSSGEAGNSLSFEADISGTGRFVAFSSFADNLVRTRASDHVDIFWRDMRTGRTRLVSVGNSGQSECDEPYISGSGWRILFSCDDNLGFDPDGPGTFVRLMGRGRTIRLDQGLGTGARDISGDGRFFVFAHGQVVGGRIGSL
jgi:Tol biopolymer transport system component